MSGFLRSQPITLAFHVILKHNFIILFLINFSILTNLWYIIYGTNHTDSVLTRVTGLLEVRWALSSAVIMISAEFTVSRNWYTKFQTYTSLNLMDDFREVTELTLTIDWFLSRDGVRLRDLKCILFALDYWQKLILDNSLWYFTCGAITSFVFVSRRVGFFFIFCFDLSKSPSCHIICCCSSSQCCCGPKTDPGRQIRSQAIASAAVNL